MTHAAGMGFFFMQVSEPSRAASPAHLPTRGKPVPLKLVELHCFEIGVWEAKSSL